MEAISIGNGGWVEVHGTAADFAVVRFEDLAGRLSIGELYLTGAPVTGDLLRSIQPRALEAWANDPAIAETLRARMTFAGPDLLRAAEHYATSFGRAAFGEHDGAVRGRHWVAEMVAAQGDGSPVPQAPRAKRRAWTPRSGEVDARLEGGADGPPYVGDFYERLAEVYIGLVARGQAPAPVIAEANGRPVTTVHRWVREARKRGHLPPGVQGKAG